MKIKAGARRPAALLRRLLIGAGMFVISVAAVAGLAPMASAMPDPPGSQYGSGVDPTVAPADPAPAGSTGFPAWAVVAIAVGTVIAVMAFTWIAVGARRGRRFRADTVET